MRPPRTARRPSRPRPAGEAERRSRGGQEHAGGQGGGAAADAGGCTVHGDLRSLGASEPLHVPVQCALRRGGLSAGGERLSAHSRRRSAPACTISSAICPEIDSVINYTLQWRLKLGVRSAGPIRDQQHRRHRRPVRCGGKAQDPGGPDRCRARPWPNGACIPGLISSFPLLGPSTLRDGFGFARRLRHCVRNQRGRASIAGGCPGGSAFPMRSTCAQISVSVTTRPARPSSTKMSASSTCASA